MRALISDIVGGGPVVAALSPPLALNGEALGKRVDEGVDHTLGEAGEEVQAGVTFPGKSPGKIGETVLAESLAALAPVVLAVAVTIAITVGGDGLAVDGDTGLVELHVLVDVGSVGATALDHQGDGAPDIDLLVASLGGHPVGRVLAADQTLADGTLGLVILGDNVDITGPGTLGTADMVG